MQHFVLHDGPEFRLERWGGGIFYALTSKDADRGVFLQDDEAGEFEQDMGNYEEAYPEETIAETCERLWNDYELAAT